LASLCRLRRVPPTDARVQAEWLDIRAEVAFHQKVAEKNHPNLGAPGQRSYWTAVKLELGAYADCFKRDYWRRTMVGVGLMFFQQFVGINGKLLVEELECWQSAMSKADSASPLIYYAPSLLSTMGIRYNMQLVLSGILNVTQLVGVTTSL
jgi:hypothetical protein